MFRKLFPLAQHSGCVRIIAPNRAGYPGSRTLHPDEVALLNRQSPDEERRSYTIDGYHKFLEIQAFETLEWLVWLIQSGIVCSSKKNEERGEGEAVKGGLVLIGWSAGNHILLSALANLPRFTADIVENLHEYLIDIVMYGQRNRHMCTLSS